MVFLIEKAVFQFVPIQLPITVRTSKCRETLPEAVLTQVSLPKVILVDKKQLKLNSEIMLHIQHKVYQLVMELLLNLMSPIQLKHHAIKFPTSVDTRTHITVLQLSKHLPRSLSPTLKLLIMHGE
jgi:hypothetical protein